MCRMLLLFASARAIIHVKEMEKTWTVVRFEDEDTVEAVPTNWIFNNKCYWPPYTKDKLLKVIKENVNFESSWANYQVYVFKNSTSESYQACRLKARKAEDVSDLNSDNNKRRRIKNRFYDSDSSSKSDDVKSEHTKLPSPPNLEEYFDTHTEISAPANKNSTTDKENTYCRKNDTQKTQKSTTRKENTYFEKRYDSLNNDVSGTSSTSIDISNIQRTYLKKDVNMHRNNTSSSTTADKNETDNNTQICTCCPTHKNNDEKFRRVFKEIFLVREMMKECYEELKVTVLQQGNVNITDKNKPTFLNKFYFPLRSIEELEEVEQYLQDRNYFQSTVTELSKIGGTTPYDFVKRCLSLLLTNRCAEKYSWYGAKKKEIFGKLHLANVLLESAQLCKAASNRKEVEEAVKAWLRRAKERAVKEDK